MGFARSTRRGIGLGSVAAWALVLGAASVTAHAQASSPPRPWVVVGDAIPEALTGVPGDPVRGRAIVANRQLGLCLLCHTGPIPEERFQGSLAPDLAGAGTRWTTGQLRLRMVDAKALNPQTLMPSYHRMDGLNRVAAAWAAAPMLSAQQVEDVVAYLTTLRE
ncbi:MAG: sulfur oxidation c-type cytochrome SoxX [Rhodoferax sp.]|nr:sulfur oxidation c-type cytochrome SoxX [Rhodoferax sp.]